MIKDPNIYFIDGCGRCNKAGTDACKARIWTEGLALLRALCRDAGLEEIARWGHPCYALNGSNVVMIVAFQGDFQLSFFKASLMKDPENLFSKRGENTQVASIINFTSADQVREMTPVITAYIQEAIAIEKAGLKPERKVASFDIPQELVDAMDADAELAEAFAALTPGRQRGYCLTIGGAKQSATRINRIEKYRAQILQGKGYNE